MPVDPIITRRFTELAAKTDALAKRKEFGFHSKEGKKYFKIPSGQFKEWATNVMNLLQRTFGENSIHYRNFSDHYARFIEWESEFKDCRAIFNAAREDYEGGYLFNVRVLAKAEVLTDALSQANEILASGYKDTACILARVALETTLKELSSRHTVPIGTLDKMNTELCKAGVYNMAKQKQITAWADIGNKAAHGDWKSYNDADARAMVQGVEAIVANLL